MAAHPSGFESEPAIMKTASFSDFDAFVDSVRDVDAVMMCQNIRHRRWSCEQAFLPNLGIQRGRLGSGNIIEGQSRKDGHLLYLPLTDDCEYRANGTTLPGNSLMILEPGCEFFLSTKDAHDWCSVFVPNGALADGQGSDSLAAKSKKAACRVIRADPFLAGSLREAVARIMTAAGTESRLETSPAAAHAESALLPIAAALVAEQAAPGHHSGRPSLPRQEIIRRCLTHLVEHEEKAITVDDLARAAKASRRTLQRAFHEVLGCGPLDYLRTRQLHLVHRALKAADREALTVKEVLFDHGVWQLGLFASSYRRTFGELPSETLRGNTC